MAKKRLYYSKAKLWPSSSETVVPSCVDGTSATTSSNCEGGSGYASQCNPTGSAAVEATATVIPCTAGSKAVELNAAGGYSCRAGSVAANKWGSGCDAGSTQLNNTCANGTGADGI